MEGKVGAIVQSRYGQGSVSSGPCGALRLDALGAWQLHAESASDSLLGLNSDRALHRIGRLFRYGEADARPFMGAVAPLGGLSKRLE